MKGNITEYHIVDSCELGSLIERVNVLINENWQPVGQMVISMDPIWYHQTMIKIQ